MTKTEMEYKVATKLDKRIWSDFVKTHPDGNIFQTPDLFDLYDNTNHYKPIFLAVIDENMDEVFGLLLAVVQREGRGILGVLSTRSIVMGGPLIKDKNPKVLNIIIKEYNSIIKKIAIYTQFRNLWEWDDDLRYIFAKNGFEYEPHLDIIHDLNKPVEEQWMSLHQGRRKNIRRAQKKNLVFKEANDTHEFEKAYQLIKQTYLRVKLPIPSKSFFEESYNVLLKQSGYLKIFFAVFKNEVIAARMVLCFKGMIYDWYAGASDKHLDKYPNDFLPWKIIEWGSLNGYKIFDFGGAGKPDVPYGVRDYKSKFGGEMFNWGRFEKVHKPLLMSIGKLGLKIYKKVY